MLIERMKTNPEEFRGSGARWAMVMNQMMQVRRGSVETNILMSRRDMNALFDAFETHVMETALAEHTITELMEPRAERKKVQVRTPGKSVLAMDPITQQALKVLEGEFDKAREEGNREKAEYLLKEYNSRYNSRYNDAMRDSFVRYNAVDRYTPYDWKPHK